MTQSCRFAAAGFLGRRAAFVQVHGFGQKRAAALGLIPLIEVTARGLRKKGHLSYMIAASVCIKLS